MSSLIATIGAPTFTITIIVVVLVIILVIWLVIRAHQGKVSAGREDLVGRTAVVEVPLEPRGVVLVEGERWTATSESGNIPVEEEVIISKVQGLKLWVTKK
jgi:membrane protein implicated in regulation of membrane protease activity